MAELLREQEVAYLVAEPEGQTLEWKSPRIHPCDLATTLVACANADGGRLLIGIEDDGTVSGLDPIADRELVERLLRAAYEYCTPGENFNLVKREELAAPLPRLIRRTGIWSAPSCAPAAGCGGWK